MSVLFVAYTYENSLQKILFSFFSLIRRIRGKDERKNMKEKESSRLFTILFVKISEGIMEYKRIIIENAILE